MKVSGTRPISTSCFSMGIFFSFTPLKLKIIIIMCSILLLFNWLGAWIFASFTNFMAKALRSSDRKSLI